MAHHIYVVAVADTIYVKLQYSYIGALRGTLVSAASLVRDSDLRHGPGVRNGPSLVVGIAPCP